MGLFKRCKHDWEVIVDKLLPSAYEQSKEKVRAVSVLDTRNIFNKTSITILRCKKCGALDKTVVKSLLDPKWKTY